MNAPAPESTPVLAGRRILLTRSAADCAAWTPSLEALGATVTALPCITSEAFETPALRAAVQAAGAAADWWVFTSRRGVERFAALAPKLAATAAAAAPGADGARATRGRRARVAVVGEATAEAARRLLGRADLRGSDGTAAGLAAELAATGVLTAGVRVLLALAENAPATLESAVRAAGAECTRVDVYRTVPAPVPTVKRALSELGADNIVLASPTAVVGFLRQVELDTPAAIYTIGPTTTAAVEQHGLVVTAEAAQPSLTGLVEAMQWAK